MSNFYNGIIFGAIDPFPEVVIKIGVISDTHDNVPATDHAVRLFNRCGVGAVIHCGDIVAPFALARFKGLRCEKFFSIFGNNDGESEGLLKIARDNGWVLARQPLSVELGGRKIVVVHEPQNIRPFLDCGQTDIILYGHTHKPKADKRNGKFLLNPGEGGGWVHGKATVAILDLAKPDAEFHELSLGTPEAL